MDPSPGAAEPRWLLCVASMPADDPASRMRVLRTLEALGTTVLREGVYLLPETEANRHSLETLADYIAKSHGSAHVLRVSAASPAQQEAFTRLFDRSARYEDLIKTVESLSIGFGKSDPSAIARVLHKQRREFEAIAALDFFPTRTRELAQAALAKADQFFAGLQQGVRYVWEKPDLLGAFSMAFLVNLLAYPFFLGLLPYVARDVYGIGQSGLGFLAGAFATGALAPCRSPGLGAGSPDFDTRAPTITRG